ncbi:hypothetical protein TNCV_2609041 [Trichonephila clavipes]|nr:hypothetical protein TNCV_2609041 [Trichonephila clavipes]
MEGNEKSRFPGKERNVFHNHMAFNSAKLLVKLEFKRRFVSYLSNEAKGKAWEYHTSSKSFIPDFSRPEAVVLFRLLTEHDVTLAFYVTTKALLRAFPFIFFHLQKGGSKVGCKEMNIKWTRVHFLSLEIP